MTGGTAGTAAFTVTTPGDGDTDDLYYKHSFTNAEKAVKYIVSA